MWQHVLNIPTARLHHRDGLGFEGSESIGQGGWVSGVWPSPRPPPPPPPPPLFFGGARPRAKGRIKSVCNVFGDPTPGPRHFPGFESSSFPWKETIDAFQTVASADAYDMSMQLSREGLIAGPSSGEALCGLLAYLQREKDAERLEDLADGSTGEISCVFICCDLPYQYIEGYFQKLGDDRFPPIQNEVSEGVNERGRVGETATSERVARRPGN